MSCIIQLRSQVLLTTDRTTRNAMSNSSPAGKSSCKLILSGPIRILCPFSCAIPCCVRCQELRAGDSSRSARRPHWATERWLGCVLWGVGSRLGCNTDLRLIIKINTSRSGAFEVRWELLADSHGVSTLGMANHLKNFTSTWMSSIGAILQWRDLARGFYWYWQEEIWQWKITRIFPSCEFFAATEVISSILVVRGLFIHKETAAENESGHSEGSKLQRKK